VGKGKGKGDREGGRSLGGGRDSMRSFLFPMPDEMKIFSMNLFHLSRWKRELSFTDY